MTAWRLIGLAAALVLVTARVSADTCPVDLFREYNPTIPPRILTDPPVRAIAASSYDDPDPEPPGNLLTLYKVHLQDGADAAYGAIKAIRVGNGTRLIWGGAGDPVACCLATACSDLCGLECVAQSGIVLAGRACSDVPSPCSLLGACCDDAKPSCGLELGATCRGLRRIFYGEGTACVAGANACPGACCTATGCFLTAAGGCSGNYVRLTPCSVEACTQWGACCGLGPPSSCSITNRVDCDFGRYYLGDGVPCARDICLAGMACCEPALGFCTMTTAYFCAASGPKVAVGSCADTPSPCEPGACCLPPYGCRRIARATCMSLGGTFTPGVACGSPPC